MSQTAERGSAPSAPNPQWEILKHYARVAQAKWWHVAGPIALTFLAASVEAISLGLLIPISEGVAENSFLFVWDLPVVSSFKPLVPESFFTAPYFDAVMTISLVGLVFFTRLFRLAIEFVRDMLTEARNARYNVDIRRDTFRRVLSFGRHYFEARPVGETHTMINWSASVIETLRAAEEFLSRSVRLLAKVAIMIAISVPLTISMAVAFPLIQIFMRLINNRAREVAKRGADAAVTINREVYDLLGTVPLVKAYSQEDNATALYGRTLETARGIQLEQAKLRLMSYPMQEGVFVVAMLVTIGMSMVIAGTYSPAELATFCAFLLVAQQSMPDFMSIHRLRLKLFEQWPIMERLHELMDDRGKYLVAEGEETFPGIRDGIELRSLEFGYLPDIPVLEGVDAVIPAGKVTAIVGESGIGKSTMVDLIARFYDCPEGSIFIDGRDIRDYTLYSLHEKMALVSQAVWLLNRSLEGNLIFGLEVPPSRDELHRIIDAVGLQPLIDRLPEGLDTEVGDRGVRLSGGEQQRLALARALLRKPDILILDEATAALDSATELKVQETLSHFAPGRTVIVIAHRLSTIRHADQILVMTKGNVAERGTYDELLERRGEFHRLWTAQGGQAPAKAS